ncbi:MAG: substrate-binding domain-containing protein [Ignavibacteriales bacterium]|nr:substrate-binding domain-containing protein [Ignavibacteriales bacterium]
MKHTLLSILFIIIAVISGCKKQNETAPLSNRLLLTADPYLPLMQQEGEQYMSLYPQVKIEVRGATTREAIVSFLNDSVHTIVIDRQFNEEEKQVAQQASLRLVEYKIAEDGIAVIVHKQNPIPNITPESVHHIVTKTATEWTQIAESRWSGPIDFVLTGRNSGLYELLQKKIFAGSKPLEPNTVMDSQRDVIQYVSAHAQSVGFVAASLLTDQTIKVKMLPILAKSPEGDEREYLPGQQEIHESLYPFHYSLYLYNAEAKAAVGVGFSALVLSNVGQKIFQTAGLVPVTIPYRTIQLHAE